MSFKKTGQSKNFKAIMFKTVAIVLEDSVTQHCKSRSLG